jgi:hypothetical protein
MPGERDEHDPEETMEDLSNEPAREDAHGADDETTGNKHEATGNGQ